MPVDGVAASHGEKENIEQGPNDFSIEKILKKKKDKNGHVFYFLKWEGYPESDNSWEPVEHIKCPEMIEEFEAELKAIKASKRKESMRRLADEENEASNTNESPRLPLKPRENKKPIIGPKRRKLGLTAARAIAEMKKQNVKNGLTAGYEPDYIVGATVLHENIHHLVKFKETEQQELIPSPYLRLCYPQLLLGFYEQNLTLGDDSPAYETHVIERVFDIQIREIDRDGSTPLSEDGQ